MINIETNNIVSVTADSENPNFPVDRVLDGHTKRPYKAIDGVNKATLTVTVSGVSNGLSLAGTNAVTISVAAENPTSISWFDDAWASSTDNVTTWVTADIDLDALVLQRSNSRSIWAELGNDLPSSVILEVTATAPAGETLEIGILEVGDGVVYTDAKGKQVNPSFGLSETKVDYSIDDELSNGASYYYPRDKVRRFKGTVNLSYESGDALLNAYDVNGKNPKAWKITDINSNRWVVFAKFESCPEITYDNFEEVEASFTLLEVV